MRITQEQIDRANAVNLPQFLIKHGFELKRMSHDEFIWKKHESLFIHDNQDGESGKWFRFSENHGGDNIDFVREYMDLDFRQAVELLNDETYIDVTFRPYSYQKSKFREIKPDKPVEIHLRENPDCRKVTDYLCRVRKLDFQLVSELIREGKISQESGYYGNVIFKCFDENHKLVGAEKCGTNEGQKFKGIEKGSASGYGFEIVRGNGENALFFESAIDMLSYLQMHPELNNHRLVSMMGVKPSVVIATMKRHGIKPENVYLCSDNDTAGNDFADRLKEVYPDMKRLCSDKNYKDWNNQLREIPIKEVMTEKMIAYGNKIWNYATDNSDKTIISFDESKFKDFVARLEDSGLNYFAYLHENKVIMAVNDDDIAHLQRIVGDNFQTTKSNRPYNPPVKNIIGNTPYREIYPKEYINLDRDTALKLAQILEKESIRYSGRIYPNGKATLTVSRNDRRFVENLKENLYNQRKRYMENIPCEGIVGNTDYHEISNRKIIFSDYTREQFQECEAFIGNQMQYAGVIQNGKIMFMTDEQNEENFRNSLKIANNIVTIRHECERKNLSEEQIDSLQDLIEKCAEKQNFGCIPDFFDARYSAEQFQQMKQAVSSYLDKAQTPENSELQSLKAEFDKQADLSDFFAHHDYDAEQKSAISENYDLIQSTSAFELIDESFNPDQISEYFSILRSSGYGDAEKFVESHRMIMNMSDEMLDYYSALSNHQPVYLHKDYASEFQNERIEFHEDSGFVIVGDTTNETDLIHYHFQTDSPEIMISNVFQSGWFEQENYVLDGLQNPNISEEIDDSFIDFDDAAPKTELTELEQYFMSDEYNLDLFLAKSALNPEQLENLSCQFIENPYKNISKENVIDWLNGQELFVTPKGYEFHAEYGEDSMTVRFGNAEREISYEDMINAFDWVFNEKYEEIENKRANQIQLEKEEAFLNADIAPMMAKSVLAWDEIEEIGYLFFEENYLEKHQPSESAIFGNGMPETELYDLAVQMNRDGEDIRRQIAIGLLGGQKSFSMNKDSVLNKDDEFQAEYGENSVIVTFGNAKREIYYEELGEAFYQLAKKEHDDIVHGRTEESPIQFGLLGNGLTVYDTSRTSEFTNDFVIVAHISEEGNIKIYDDAISDSDMQRIQNEADTLRQKFLQGWNALNIYQKYSKLIDNADIATNLNMTAEKLSLEEIVEKYTPFVMFQEGERPEPELIVNVRTEEEKQSTLKNDLTRILGEEQADTFIPELIKAFENNPVSSAEDNPAKEGELKAAMFDILGDEEQTEEVYSAFLDFTNPYSSDARQNYDIKEKAIETEISDNQLARAKQLISDFVEEFDVGADFDDLSHVNLAFRFDKETKLPIMVYADLENPSIIKEYNDEIVSTTNYDTLEIMCQDLEKLNFNNLVTLSDEEKSKVKTAEIQPIDEDTPLFADADVIQKIQENEHADDFRLYPDTEGEQLSLFGDSEPMQTPKKEKYETGLIVGGVNRFKALSDDIMRGTGFQDGKFRVQEFYQKNHPTNQEFADFLSDAYGTGGHSGDGDISFVHQDSKGMYFKLETGEKFKFTWSEVAKEISEKIENDEYLTQQDMENHERFSKPESDELKIGDKFRNKISGEICEVVSLTGALPFYTDQCTVSKQNGAFQITENIGKNDLLNPDKFERVTETEKVIETPKPEKDFHITDDALGEGGQKAKFQANIQAIKTLKTLEKEKRPATDEEKETLSKYVGWGGIAQAFDENNSSWTNEYQQLKDLLTPQEYTSARASTLDAFYTTPTVINSIYEALENFGFEGGNILEPSCGVGNFFGCMPEDMRKESSLYGVEIDSISGRIAQKIYPDAEIAIQGFEKNEFQNGCFDVAVGNVPFGDLGFKDDKHQTTKLHDYFFAEALDKVKTGGIIAFVTSAGTLDKADERTRQALADKANLIGAIRLPSTAFKQNANTEVTTDIIFLQKHGDKPISEMLDVPDWVHLGETENGLPINKYFEQNPDMILGEVVEGNKLYGKSGTMVIPTEGADLKEQLQTAVLKLSATISDERARDVYAKAEHGEVKIPSNLRNYSFFEHENHIYFKTSDSVCSFRFDRINSHHRRAKAFIELRDTTRELLTAQELNKPDSEIKELQAKLNKIYDDFYKKYGLLHNRTNRKLFSEDVSYNLVCSLEKEFDKDKLVAKSDLFTKRTIRPPQAIEHVESVSEALTLSMAEKAKVNFQYMSELTGLTEDELKKELEGQIFKVPHTENEYQTASEYLSGDIYKKLREAEEIAEYDSDFSINVSVLKQAIPTPLKAGDIEVKIGAAWIDPKL